MNGAEIVFKSSATARRMTGPLDGFPGWRQDGPLFEGLRFGKAASVELQGRS